MNEWLKPHIEESEAGLWKSQVTYRPSWTALKRSPNSPGSGALCLRKAAHRGVIPCNPDLPRAE